MLRVRLPIVADVITIFAKILQMWDKFWKKWENIRVCMEKYTKMVREIRRHSAGHQEMSDDNHPEYDNHRHSSELELIISAKDINLRFHLRLSVFFC